MISLDNKCCYIAIETRFFAARVLAYNILSLGFIVRLAYLSQIDEPQIGHFVKKNPKTF